MQARDFLGLTEIEGGFPHSEIRGSKLVRSSPRLIAAYHVLHRLSAPRHPPNTLKALDRSHYRCPPLGSGPFPFRDQVCIDRKTSLLQTHPRALRSRGAHLLVARLRFERSRSIEDDRMHFLFTMTDNTHFDNAPKCGTFSRTFCDAVFGDPRIWWSQTGSNRRPHACKARALPTELWPRAVPIGKSGGPGKT